MTTSSADSSFSRTNFFFLDLPLACLMGVGSPNAGSRANGPIFLPLYNLAMHSRCWVTDLAYVCRSCTWAFCLVWATSIRALAACLAGAICHCFLLGAVLVWGRPGRCDACSTPWDLLVQLLAETNWARAGFIFCSTGSSLDSLIRPLCL